MRYRSGAHGPIPLISKRKPIVQWQPGSSTRKSDLLAVEEPLEIQVDARSVAVTMRTPGHDRELAAGFLLSEGLIGQPTDIRKIQPSPRHTRKNVLNVFLDPSLKIDFSRLTRHVFASSSCGLCGKASIQAVHQHFKPITSKLQVKATVLQELSGKLRQAQHGFDQTGGLHAAGIFGTEGDLVVLREDVGRHNAVDKVIGHGLLNDHLPYDQHILMVSGRASFEILQKALAARIAIIAAVSAPSTLAVEFARRSRQTLIGFLRPNRMNLYSGAKRILFF